MVGLRCLDFRSNYQFLSLSSSRGELTSTHGFKCLPGPLEWEAGRIFRRKGTTETTCRAIRPASSTARRARSGFMGILFNASLAARGLQYMTGKFE